MKRLLFVVLLLIHISLSGQHIDSSKNRKDNVKPGGDTSKIHSTKLSHSKYYLAIDKSGYQDDNIKVTIGKDEASGDFWKYVFPIITLLLGIGVNKSLEYFSSKKKITKTGKRWIAELSSLKIPIEKQIEYLWQFKTEHDKEIFSIPEIQVASSLEGEVFKSLDRGEFVQYIEKEKKINFNSAVVTAGSVNSYISILVDHRTAFLKKVEEYMTALSSLTNSFSIHLQDSLRRFSEFQIAIEKDTGVDAINDPVFAQIVKLYEDHIFPYMVNGEYDIFVLEEKFMIPLAAILSIQRHDERLKGLGESLTGLFSDVKRIRMERRYMSENTSIIIGRYQQSLNELPQIMAKVQ